MQKEKRGKDTNVKQFKDLRVKKLHPKLREIAGSNEEENELRAELSSIVYLRKRPKSRQLRGLDAKVIGYRALKPEAKKDVSKLSRNIFVNVYIRLKPDGKLPPGIAKDGRNAVVGDARLVPARINLAQLPALLKSEDVLYIEPAEPIKRPPPIALEVIARDANGDAPPKRAIDIDEERPDIGLTAYRRGLIKSGRENGVLIGIIDVQGFDFGHEDFVDAGGKTRFLRIWDQGGANRDAPKGFGFGAEITQAHMNAALAAEKSTGTSAALLEQQSWMSVGSHGTHVASIAAGNHGVCPNAKIAGVLISLSEEQRDDSRLSFYDSTRLVDAIQYLLNVAEEEKLPIAINISLGTNGDAHDGSGPLCQWLDGGLAKPGRAVCVAAGNAGQERGERSDDFGWMVGRIHASGRIPAKGLSVDLDWTVVGDRIADVSENELEIWYAAQDRIAVSVRPPGATEFIGPVGPREFIFNKQLDNGTDLSIYNETYAPSNGENCVSIYLIPPLHRQPGGTVGGVAAGVWTVRLTGLDVRDGRFHGWIERDDPVRAFSASSDPRPWRFPSFFSERSNVDERSIGSLACAPRVIGVANLDEAENKIHITSSEGPTRDDRAKPDIAAPGTNIVAANGFHNRGVAGAWLPMTGTSMASPHVTGVVAEMLRIRPQLTAAQIIGILRRTARPLPGASYAWTKDAGYGRIDGVACLVEASRSGERYNVG